MGQPLRYVNILYIYSLKKNYNNQLTLAKSTLNIHTKKYSWNKNLFLFEGGQKYKIIYLIKTL